MKDKIVQLIRIQDCDSRIDGILQKTKECPLKIQHLQIELQETEAKIEEENLLLEASKKEHREIDDDIKELDSKVSKSQEKLDNIKSNKEYKAVLKEIESIKKIKESKEDRAIQLLEEIEGMEKKGIENKNLKAEIQKKFDQDKAEIEKEIALLEGSLKELNKEKDDFTAKIDQGLLKKYSALKTHKNGLAIGSVINGVCQTCHMVIPPQKFNEVIRGNDLHSCPHCQRLIYWGEDEYFQNPRDQVE